MDLNPYEFTAPYEKKEFSNFCFDKRVDIVIFLTNWLNSDENDESEEKSYDLINYWVDRCSPLLNKKISYFLAANRCGIERTTKFAGSSVIVKLNKNPDLIQKLSIKNEGVIYNSIELTI